MTEGMVLYKTLLPEIQSKWTQEKIDFIRRSAAPKASDESFRTMMYKATKYGLDPLNNEIYCYPMGGKDMIYTGLAGLLNIAHQTGHWGGIDSDVVLDESGNLVGAWATCWRNDSPHPTTARVRFKEYSTGQNLWAPDKKPETMIQKVAKCQALRMAYNISGLYDRDEMGSADIAAEAAAQGNQAVIDTRTGEVMPTKTRPTTTVRISTPPPVPDDLENARRKVGALESAVLDAGGKLELEEEAVYGNKETKQGGYTVAQLDRYAVELEKQLAEITSAAT